jgi:ABC-2 type transport system ATP-binding protein
MEVNMIQINNLVFNYRKKGSLFKELCLELEPGSIYGLLGKNGAGKTTLLKLIAGALFLKSGEMSVFNENPENRKPELMKDIYFIPEEFYVPQIKIETYTDIYSPFYPRFDKAMFRNYIDEFQLNEKDILTDLSYGQKKKFLIGFGLSTNCRLLILDEPTNGLDIPSKSQFRKLLASSITDQKSFIISTHQVRDLENLIDPVIIIDDGIIIFNNSMMQVSEKFTVSMTQDEPTAEETLYSEKVLGGYTVLKENTENADSRIDLELFFNAVITNPSKIAEILKTEEKNADK